MITEHKIVFHFLKLHQNIFKVFFYVFNTASTMLSEMISFIGLPFQFIDIVLKALTDILFNARNKNGKYSSSLSGEMCGTHLTPEMNLRWIYPE